MRAAIGPVYYLRVLSTFNKLLRLVLYITCTRRRHLINDCDWSAGHNTDGKYFVTSNKLGFSCETRPRRVMVFIDKARDGTITPVMDVEITDLACGPNHIVSTAFGNWLQISNNPSNGDFAINLRSLIKW